MTDKPRLADGQRERLTAQLGALAEAAKRAREAMESFRQILTSIEEAEESLLEAHGIEIRGRCESCGEVILEGERTYSYDDGPMFCEAHSPTWEDVRSETEELNAAARTDDEEEIERRRLALQAVAENLAAGGKLTDKVAYL